MRLFLTLFILFALVGCSHFDRPDDPNFAPVFPALNSKPPPIDGSVYHAGTGLSLYEDIKALRVGDIITVMLSEETDASKSGESKFDKASTATMANPTLFSTTPDFGFHKSLPIPLTTTQNLNLETSIDAQRDFDGSSEAKQKNKLTGTITVTVTKVYPNGNLFVRGEKWITINHGEEFIRLSGMIRPEDISPDNSITSNRIADARITYSGTGSLQNANKPGWLTRLFSHWLFPL
jgi:flagellar L-ring protein FlgH